MDTFIGDSVAASQFLDGGGLYGTEDAVNFVIRKGETTRVDGPYAEAKEVIAGGKSPTYMKNAQAAIAAQLPNGRLEELPGQTHIVRGKATVPVLRRFFS